ncbi:unnamed protein product [Prorocentrum cordatum]|uniref:Uncharacterized protein n=1 Tax=Prorocentrum cordatum TaxID=2364126 RepID=A0ABN9T0R8_9DINO|nr:unnamed protein product [Polarella glacialis]
MEHSQAQLPEHMHRLFNSEYARWQLGFLEVALESREPEGHPLLVGTEAFTIKELIDVLRWSRLGKKGLCTLVRSGCNVEPLAVGGLAGGLSELRLAREQMYRAQLHFWGLL